jgi:hypothetical protein
MHYIVRLAKVRAEKVGHKEAHYSYKNEYNTDESCNGLCHGVSFSLLKLETTAIICPLSFLNSEGRACEVTVLFDQGVLKRVHCSDLILLTAVLLVLIT